MARSPEMSSGREQNRIAELAKWGGVGIAFLGALTGVGALIVPGLAVGAGGYIYDRATAPQRRVA